jgi:hypothetical protein
MADADSGLRSAVTEMMFELHALRLIQIEFMALLMGTTEDPDEALRELSELVNGSIDRAGEAPTPAMEQMLGKQRQYIDLYLGMIRQRLPVQT